MKCVGVAVIAALLGLTVRKHGPAFGALIGVAGALLIGVLGLELLRPVLTFAGNLQEKAKLSQGVVSPVLRTLAIGLLTQIGKSICEDAGEKTVGQALSLAGGAAAMYVLLPLLQGVLDLMDRIL